MTYPVFASGDVLNASDMNGVGLWLVKTQAVGSGVSSVTVTGAFSADYDNYKVVYSGGVMSGANDISMTIGGVTANYYGSLTFTSFSAGSPSGIGTNNGANVRYAGGGDGSFAVVDVDVINPFNTVATLVMGPYQNNSAMGVLSYRLATTSSYTSFSIFPNAGTMTGGTIRVYGFRN